MTSAHELDHGESSTPVPDWLAVPEAGLRAPVWDRPLSRAGGRPPAIWLLGAHGGAGVSTLESMWAPAADSRRGWPAAETTPFVVVVARMHAAGLDAAHRLCLQHQGGSTGGCELLGLVTVAAAPGKPAVSLSRRRELVAASAGASWHIDWVPELLTATADELTIWQPGYVGPPTKRLARSPGPTEAVPPSIATAATEVFDAASAAWRRTKTT
ncbi:MAG TPA: hypothetical protein H9755_04275 [Candidatus Dietzia intestinigallinarum]|nr:hypothetical protein [Candidatus Dietzia intestinigallinarum]